MPEKEDRRDERDDGGREERRSRYTRDEKVCGCSAGVCAVTRLLLQTLSDRQFDEFTDLLRAISIARQTIKAAMVSRHLLAAVQMETRNLVQKSHAIDSQLHANFWNADGFD